jgi:hypothetical protein
MTKYLLLAVCFLFTGYVQSAESKVYFCSNTEKPPTLRVITLEGQSATIEMEGLKPQYNVLENIEELLVLGKIVGLTENESTRDGYSILVMDKRTMIMQVVNALTDKPYVETKSTCMARN